jgi:phosphoglycerol transferase
MPPIPKLKLSIHFVGISLFLGVFVYRLLKWILRSFGDVTPDQVFFHLITNTDGIPTAISKKLALEIGLKPLIAVLIFYFLIYISKNIPILLKLLKWSVLAGALFLIFATSYRTNLMFKPGQIDSEFAAIYKNLDWYDNLYKEPKVKSKPQSNLIWIYIESLDHRLINNENNLKNNHRQTIGSFTSLSGTGWTFAGILASQCGVPHLIGSSTSHKSSRKPIVCLPDILKSFGYELYFIGGASLNFSDKGQFLRAKGFDTLIGRDELPKILQVEPPNRKEYWGYRDDQIFPVFEQDILKAHKKGKPFYYVALTLDTHGPLVHSDDCKKFELDTSEQGIFDCALKRTSLFIERLNKAGVLENTTVVVSGDHPMMRTDDFNLRDIVSMHKVERDKVSYFIRSPNNVLNPKSIPSNKLANHFDLYPTVFSSIGGGLKSDGFGLGKNLYEATSLLEKYSEEQINYMFARRSKAYESISWGLSREPVGN